MPYGKFLSTLIRGKVLKAKEYPKREFAEFNF